LVEADKSFSEFAKTFVKEMGKMIAKLMIMKALQNSSFGGLITGAQGRVFDNGRLVPLAHGGVVSGPTLMPMRSGSALIGEAGPEGVLPLRRDSQGDLGVKATMNVNVHNNVGADVSVRQSGDDVDIYLNRVAAEIARGGSPIAHAIEGTYRVGRGR
jgi:phage-related minor tail protein